MTANRLYRVFVQDVGESGYSAIGDTLASSAEQAVENMRLQKRHSWDKRDMKAFWHGDKTGWPDSKTGLVPRPDAIRTDRVSKPVEPQDVA